MFEIKLSPCKKEMLEDLSDALENFNALSITLTDLNDEPILEPLPGEVPLWTDVVMQVLFESQENVDAACKYIKTHYCNLQITQQLIADLDWQQACIADIKPLSFGNKLWIYPSWMTASDPNAIVVTLDPGLAFGTGTHPTTALCLRWLDAHDVAGKEVIDYGCGSGVLGIAALKLGAQHVHAIDLDPQALIATQQNADLNKISNEQITISLPDTEPKQADIILANILLNPLLSLKKAFYSYLKPQGILVISGILPEQIDSLIHAYQTDFQHQQTIIDDNWTLVVFYK